MKAEQLQLALRPRPAYEAVDLGVAMAQRGARSLRRAYLPLALLLVVACGATIELAPWLPGLLLWWFLPWLDSTLLHIFARQAFGDETGFDDAWAARRKAPWLPMILWLTIWRLSFWRAYSMPVAQLEGQAGAARRQRVAAILRSHRGAAMMMQSTFGWIWFFMMLGLAALLPLMTPGLSSTRTLNWLDGGSLGATGALYAAQAVAMLFVEPFFVASGFAMYLNRRVELEAWDIEQDLRHAFAARADLVRLLARAALLVACACGGADASAQVGLTMPTMTPAQEASMDARTASSDPRALRIDAEVDKLRTDPLLAGKHKEHRLRWIGGADDKPEAPAKPPDLSMFRWLADLVRFLNDTSRFLLWGLVAVLVALALVGMRHVFQLRAFGRMKAQPAVSHVRDLDVRPESLPDDVGAAAWALWQSGRVPAALSLLYRGALSRMIHRFQVPVTASATEAECLELARGRLEAGALRYVTQVVRAWEASIYGGRTLSLAMGEALCTGFGPRLDASAPPAAEIGA